MEEIKKTKESETTEINKNINKEENPYLIELTEPVEYQQIKIKEIDMKGLTELTAKDLIDLQTVYEYAVGEREISPEVTYRYCMITAAKITELPIELFDKIKAKDAIKIRRMVTNFFFA